MRSHLASSPRGHRLPVALTVCELEWSVAQRDGPPVLVWAGIFGILGLKFSISSSGNGKLIRLCHF